MGRNASRAFNTSCGAAARGSQDMPASTVKKIATPNELRGPGGRQLRQSEEGAERAGLSGVGRSTACLFPRRLIISLGNCVATQTECRHDAGILFHFPMLVGLLRAVSSLSAWWKTVGAMLGHCRPR